MAVATAALAVSAGVSIFSGLLGASSERKARKAQKASQAKQMQLAESEYAQQAQDRQKWNEMYGSVEHNLAQYVKDLDSSATYKKMEGNIKAKFDTARTTALETLADRGFDVGGGVTADTLANISSQEAQFKIEYEQKIKANHQEQRQGLLSNNREPQRPSTTNMSNLLGNQQISDNKYYKSQADSFGAIGEAFNRGVTDYMAQNNSKTVRTEAGTEVTGATESAYGDNELFYKWKD